MTDLDRQIEEALDAEDRALLEQFGEQGLWAQAFSVYDGKLRWIVVFATFLTFALFGGAVFSAWKFFSATDALFAVRWASVAWMLMIMVGFLKMWFWMRMESNRVLREIKRVELQVARLQTRRIA